MKFINALINRFGKIYCNKICKREYNNPFFNSINERPIEYRFVFESLTKACPETVLDVGTGMSALPHLINNCGFKVTAIDNIYDYWSKGMFNRHYHIIHDDITMTKLDSKFDFITCISVLKHIPNYEIAVKNIFKLLKKHGYLILTFPYNEHNYFYNIYNHPKAGYGKTKPYICQVFSRNELYKLLNTINGKIIKQEYWQCFNGEYWTIGERLYPPKQVQKNDKYQLTCLLIQKN